MRLPNAIIVAAMIIAFAMVFGSVADYYTFRSDPVETEDVNGWIII